MLKFGDTIKIKPEHQDAFDILTERIRDAHAGFQAACHLLNETKKNLFDSIQQNYPETEDRILTFNHNTNEITVLNNKEK